MPLYSCLFVHPFLHPLYRSPSPHPPPHIYPQFKAPKLEIKRDPRGTVTVPGVTVVEVTSASQLMTNIQAGLQRRHTSSTNMNRESSRSHLIITVQIESTNLQTQSVTRGKLSFVDLAGSERVKKSGSAGEQLKEAQAINKSLSALGDVISALASEQAHIPYRNHKLTMLMSDSIGGTAKTLMFVNVSPTDSNLDETQNSLQYAQRVRTIKNDVTKHESSKEVWVVVVVMAGWCWGGQTLPCTASMPCPTYCRHPYTC